MKKPQYLLGAHLSISGGVDKALIQAKELGCTCAQIFTHSNRSWNFRTLEKNEINAFKKLQHDYEIKPIVSHASYMINLASPKKETLETSVWGLQEELKRCGQLAIPYLVLHPGSHTGAGIEKGIRTIAKSLDSALETTPGTTIILLENMAGQGSVIGSSFEELATLYRNIKNKDRIGFCFDTCHAWASGYNFSTPENYTSMWQDFKNKLDITKLKVIHLNNSKTAQGSHVDRHAGILDGLMPKSCFKMLMNDPQFFTCAKIIETPKSKDLTLDRKNLQDLKTMLTTTTKELFAT